MEVACSGSHFSSSALVSESLSEVTYQIEELSFRANLRELRYRFTGDGVLDAHIHANLTVEIKVGSEDYEIRPQNATHFRQCLSGKAFRIGNCQISLGARNILAGHGAQLVSGGEFGCKHLGKCGGQPILALVRA